MEYPFEGENYEYEDYLAAAKRKWRIVSDTVHQKSQDELRKLLQDLSGHEHAFKRDFDAPDYFREEFMLITMNVRHDLEVFYFILYLMKCYGEFLDTHKIKCALNDIHRNNINDARRDINKLALPEDIIHAHNDRVENNDSCLNVDWLLSIKQISGEFKIAASVAEGQINDYCSDWSSIAPSHDQPLRNAREHRRMPPGFIVLLTEHWYKFFITVSIC